MQVSPMTDGLQTPAMWQLAQGIRQRQQQWQQELTAPDLARFAQEFHGHMMAVERAVLADDLRRYDVSTEEISVEGLASPRSLVSTETDLSAAGPVTVRRHLYRPAGRSTPSLCPLE